MSATFHFSPRPNRAAEIAWQPWDERAFAAARESDKPILLAISAVWCHWCHVMDETTYSEPAVIEEINAHYIPIRVDNDQRPDINARYNMGGWPTTAMLTPDGSILTGATYMPPAQMLRALGQIREFYAQRKDEITQKLGEQQTQTASTPPSADTLRESMIARVCEEAADLYDPQYGGFGTEPKFPQTDLLEMLLREYRAGGEERLYEMVATTMLGMSRGGMYDHVEGGFFRYSTTRDWSVPHFEKMLEDHAGLIRILVSLLRCGHNPQFMETLRSAVGYLRTVLYGQQGGFFGGSQDADEEYYAKDAAERAKLQAPYIDRTVYANWNAAIAGALLGAALELADDELAASALGVLDRLHDRFLDSRGLLRHFARPGEEPQGDGLLTDHSAYLRALLDAHEFSGQERFLTRATALAAVIQEQFAAPDGGFFDIAAGSTQLGRLSMSDRPLSENAWIADSFLRIAQLVGEVRYRDRAHATLSVYSGTYGRAGVFAAPFAHALRRYFSGQRTLTITGPPQETQAFRDAAARLPDPLLATRTASGDSAYAVLCKGTTCGPRINSASELRAVYDTLQ